MRESRFIHRSSLAAQWAPDTEVEVHSSKLGEFASGIGRRLRRLSQLPAVTATNDPSGIDHRVAASKKAEALALGVPRTVRSLPEHNYEPAAAERHVCRSAAASAPVGPPSSTSHIGAEERRRKPGAAVPPVPPRIGEERARRLGGGRRAVLADVTLSHVLEGLGPASGVVGIVGAAGGAPSLTVHRTQAPSESPGMQPPPPIPAHNLGVSGSCSNLGSSESGPSPAACPAESPRPEVMLDMGVAWR